MCPQGTHLVSTKRVAHHHPSATHSCMLTSTARARATCCNRRRRVARCLIRHRGQLCDMPPWRAASSVHQVRQHIRHYVLTAPLPQPPCTLLLWQHTHTPACSGHLGSWCTSSTCIRTLPVGTRSSTGYAVQYTQAKKNKTHPVQQRHSTL